MQKKEENHKWEQYLQFFLKLRKQGLNWTIKQIKSMLFFSNLACSQIAWVSGLPKELGERGIFQKRLILRLVHRPSIFS